ncbi:MAG: dienelactone hydrolase family protein [Bacteroidetes bacterium]|nr:dienelactone hydrolase family protein [Bacteroidota bacterium]
MKVSPLKINVSESAESVSAELISPDEPVALITLAHGAGAGMNHSFMVAVAKALAENAIASLRFNFPFTEQKKKRPDFPAVAHKTIEAALTTAHQLLPNIPVFASGKSFGGRMSSQYLAKEKVEYVKGIIFYGFPLHPAGKPSVDRGDHLKEVKVPMLFLQGTRDALAKVNLIEQVATELKHAKLNWLEGADHSFKAGKQNLIPELAQQTKSWIESVLKK